ncbi:MAG: ATP-binding protein [Thermodesulfobacteriota bacterium]
MKNETDEKLEKRIQDVEETKFDKDPEQERFNRQRNTYRLLMDISTNCINIPIDAIEKAIQTSLKRIGEFVGADRAYIFKYDFEKNIGINTHEWCSKGIEPQIQNLQESPVDAFPDWVESHRNKNPVVIHEIAELSTNLMKDILSQQGIKSLLSVPIFHEDTLFGFCGFDSVRNAHRYTADEIEIVQMFSQIIMSLHNCTKQKKKRKKVEDALLHSEEKHRLFFENSPIGIIHYNHEGIITDVNETMIDTFGSSYEKLVGQGIDDIPDKKFSKEVYRSLDGKPGYFEGRYSSHTGNKTSYIKADWIPIKKESEIIAGVGIIEDITERKKREEEKIKTQKIIADQKRLAFVGQIAGKMAHDFNNILAVIMGNAQLGILDSKEEEIIKTFELIFNQTMRGKNLTKNLVAFAKDQEPKQEFFRFSEKIDLIINLLRKDLEGIEIIKEEKSGLPELLADPGMIEHGLVNLIQNSIHALSLVKHPKIIIRTYKFDNNLCCEIEDNGCGIPKKHLKNIYEPSFTLKGSQDVTQSYASDIKGTGYGMANLKKYIELHKGNVFVESKSGYGTKFTIKIPIIKKELTTKEKTELQQETAYFEKYILLVEDEQSLSDIQYKILTQDPSNHKVDMAINGQVAMDLFDRNQYDCVSLDYVLPGGINGMDVYNHIRKTNKTIPILFISGNIEFLESIKELKKKDPCVDHQSKPCLNIDYVNNINKLLGI